MGPYDLLRSALFMLPAEDAHHLAMASLGALEELAPARVAVRRHFTTPPSAVRSRWGLAFPTPIGLAAGLDKNARAPRALASLGFGFLELGTVTALPQDENPRPNMFRLPRDRALINRLGFPNDGALVVARRFEREVGRGGAGVPVGFSIGKSRLVPIEALDAVIDDYLTSFRAVRTVADFVVVNVSSPNTKGLRALQGPALAGALLTRLMTENERPGISRVPLLLKLSPDLVEREVDALLAVVRDTRLDGVIATNTTVARDGLRALPAVVKAMGAGGLSGPPLLPRVLTLVPRIRATLGPKATVIAVGGIGDVNDVRRCLEAGADLVQLYTSFVYEGPGLPSRLARELSP